MVDIAVIGADKGIQTNIGALVWCGLSLELLGSSWQTVWEVGKVRGCGMDGLNYL